MKNFSYHKKIVLEQYSSYREFVQAAQEKLEDLGYNLGPKGADGFIGRFTREALKKFQLKNGGNGKGNLGPWTAKKLGIEYFGGETTQDGGKKIKGDDNTKTTTDDKKLPEKCLAYQIHPSLKETLGKVCGGQTKNVGKGAKGCAQYVREKTGHWQGNAWHAYKLKDTYPSKVDGFGKIFSTANQKKMAEIFQKINSQSKGLDESGINSSGTFPDIKSLVNSAVPDQSSFKNLKIGDVVGIYYPSSKHHGEAFFQAAIGQSSGGEQVTGGPYFRVVEGGKSRPWTINDLGKNLKIVPGDSLLRGQRFGFNTHLGFVGAKSPKGEPIIYHSVNNSVLATPLSQMGGDFRLVWARPANP